MVFYELKYSLNYLLNDGQNPGRTIRHGNGRFRGIPEIWWKQYSGERIRWPDSSGSARNWQETVKTGSRVRSPDSCVESPAFSDGFRPETVSFLMVFTGNSRNTASVFIVLGMKLFFFSTKLIYPVSRNLVYFHLFSFLQSKSLHFILRKLSEI